MAIDQQPFPMNALDLQGKNVLIRPEVAESANKDNVVVGEPRDNKEKDKVLAREVALSRNPDGKEVIKITIKNPTPGGKLPEKKATLGGQLPEKQRSPPRFIKPRSPEVGRWKTNKVKSRPKHIKPTFDMLFSKYSGQKAGFNSNRPYLGKRPRSPSGEETSRNFRPARPEK